MARWRLMSSHYVNVEQLPDGTKIEWEHKETARESGRTVRKLYPVPMLLDPKDAADHNYPGEIIVANKFDRAYPNDIILIGDPTDEMEPLDDEAEAILAPIRERKVHPIDSLPINGGMSTAEQKFMENMMAQFAKEIGASMPKANAAVPNDEVTELKERLAKLEALLLAQAKPAATPAIARRA